MVLEVRKLITMLEECCPWYIFTVKPQEFLQISPQILRKATAKSVSLGRKNQNKVPRNPGGTEKFGLVRFLILVSFLKTKTFLMLQNYNVSKLQIKNLFQ